MLWDVRLQVCVVLHWMNDGDDEVIGMICIKDLEAESVMVVSEQGYGKRSDIEDYRKTNRGGKGVKTMNITKNR